MKKSMNKNNDYDPITKRVIMDYEFRAHMLLNDGINTFDEIDIAALSEWILNDVRIGGMVHKFFDAGLLFDWILENVNDKFVRFSTHYKIEVLKELTEMTQNGEIDILDEVHKEKIIDFVVNSKHLINYIHKFLDIKLISEWLLETDITLDLLAEFHESLINQ